MTLINHRWPSDLAPSRCQWGRTRNDMLGVSPRSRQEHVIKQSRPLWTCSLSWDLTRGVDEARLRYLLEGLEGYAGSVQLWDWGALGNAAAPAGLMWTNLGVDYAWTHYGIISQWQGAATYLANGTAGNVAVLISGLTPSVPAILQGGYLQIDRRLYIADNAYSANGAGVATIGITTPLLKTYINATSRLVEAGCEMRMVKQDWQAARSAGASLSSVTAEFVETVEDYT